MPRTRLRRPGGDMADVRTSGVPSRARTLRNESSISGRKRWAAGALATAVTAGTFGVFAPPVFAAVQDGRAIEIFHGRNIVGLAGYPANTPVTAEVFRGEERIGFATLTTDGTGFVEINHVGGGDCWQSEFTPNILPGDVVRTTVRGETAQDFSVTRDVFIEQEADFLPGNIIRVTGHAKSTPDAPIGGDDAVELRMNKVNRDNGWETNNGRVDLRLGDVLPTAQPDGTYTHDFVVSADDWNDAQVNGIDISTVWLHGVTENAEATELTFYDGQPEPTDGCPPLLPDDRIAPSQVTGVVSTQPAPGTVELDWAAASDAVGVTGYVVTRSNTDTGAVTTAQAGNNLFWSQTRVPTGRYSYTVHAVDAAGNAGAKSAPVSVGVGVDPAPLAPTGVSASVTGSSVALSWTAPAEGTPAVSYQVLRNGTALPVVVSGTTYTDANRPVGNYTYTVKSRAADGTLSAESIAATAEVVTPPDTTAPSTVTLSGSVAGTTANLSWTAATDNVGVTAYRVLRNGVQVGADLPITQRTFADTGLAQGTYSYTVRAVDAAGNASTSLARSLTVDTTAPSAAALSGSTTGSTANLSWTAATDNVGVTGYQVFRNGTQVGANLASTARSVSHANLAPGTYSYVVRAIDAAGNFSASNTLSLTVASTNVAPTVTARTPAVNATSVGVAGNITATFSEAVNGVSGTTFVLRNAATNATVGAVVSRDGTTNRWILNPNANLANDTRYTVTLTGGAAAIRDLQNAALVTTSWSFTTGPAPTVTARTPGISATGVARANNITATFSEAVQNVSGTTFYLRTATGTTNIAATVSRNGTTNQWILNPSANLAANTQYRVTLDGGAAAIRDNANNPLTDVSWTFTTGA